MLGNLVCKIIEKIRKGAGVLILTGWKIDCLFNFIQKKKGVWVIMIPKQLRKLTRNVTDKVNPMKILKERISLVDNLEKDLEEQGVVFFKPVEMKGTLNIDTTYLALPKDMTECPSHSLGQYLNAFTQQKMYMRTLIGWQEIIIEECKREYYTKSDEKYRSFSGARLSETEKERRINNDPSIQPFFFKYKDYKKKLLLLELNLASIEDGIFTISREISRRNGDIESENRNYNVSRR